MFKKIALPLLVLIMLAFKFVCCNPELLKKRELPSNYLVPEDIVFKGKVLTSYNEEEGFDFPFTYSPSLLISGDNKIYTKEVAKMASVMMEDIYNNVAYINNKKSSSKIKKDDNIHLYKSMKLMDVEQVTFKSEDFSEDKNDITTYIFSHQEYNYNEEPYSIILVAIRGTEGSFAQWTSNFDVGADSEEYEAITGPHSMWKNKLNHKGFDVIANRINEKLNKYIEEKVNFPEAKKIVLFTGHSKAAAVANILGSMYEKNPDFKTWTYTFATPETTTASDCNNYNTIFNIINQDDLITALPLNSMGFKRYGKDMIASIQNDKNNDNTKYSDDWKAMTNPPVKYISANASETVASMEKMCSDRNEIYKITDSKNNVFSNTVFDVKATEEREKKDLISYGLDLFGKINFDVGFLKYSIKGIISPAFAYQFLATVLPLYLKEGTISAATFLYKYYAGFSEVYKTAISSIIKNGITGGIDSSHAVHGYNLLSTKF